MEDDLADLFDSDADSISDIEEQMEIEEQQRAEEAKQRAEAASKIRHVAGRKSKKSKNVSGVQKPFDKYPDGRPKVGSNKDPRDHRNRDRDGKPRNKTRFDFKNLPARCDLDEQDLRDLVAILTCFFDQVDGKGEPYQRKRVILLREKNPKGWVPFEGLPMRARKIIMRAKWLENVARRCKKGETGPGHQGTKNLPRIFQWARVDDSDCGHFKHFIRLRREDDAAVGYEEPTAYWNQPEARKHRHLYAKVNVVQDLSHIKLDPTVSSSLKLDPTIMPSSLKLGPTRSKTEPLFTNGSCPTNGLFGSFAGSCGSSGSVAAGSSSAPLEASLSRTNSSTNASATDSGLSPDAEADPEGAPLDEDDLDDADLCLLVERMRISVHVDEDDGEGE